MGRRLITTALGFAVAVMSAQPLRAEEKPVTVDAEGALHITGLVVPNSALASEQARKARTDFGGDPTAWPDLEAIRKSRGKEGAFRTPELQKFQDRFPVTITAQVIG